MLSIKRCSPKSLYHSFSTIPVAKRKKNVARHSLVAPKRHATLHLGKPKHKYRPFKAIFNIEFLQDFANARSFFGLFPFLIDISLIPYSFTVDRDNNNLIVNTLNALSFVEYVSFCFHSWTRDIKYKCTFNTRAIHSIPVETKRFFVTVRNIFVAVQRKLSTREKDLLPIGVGKYLHIFNRGVVIKRLNKLEPPNTFIIILHVYYQRDESGRNHQFHNWIHRHEAVVCLLSLLRSTCGAVHIVTFINNNRKPLSRIRVKILRYGICCSVDLWCSIRNNDHTELVESKLHVVPWLASAWSDKVLTHR
mmetsp:Transcript_3247/g.5977  ORF Transcript_3247/g.5977 Transcript_3247/m.5977 type:complete len:306 (-) Transcript_3247:268-1185(-)